MAVMLSYSRKDEDVVKALARGLEAAKRDVWFDHDLGGGDAWWHTILENIRTASVFLFALSDASLHSKPCRLELDYALELGRPVVPVQVGPIASLRANPLAELQIIGYSPDNAQTGFTVLAAVDDAAQRTRPLPDPLPPPPPIPFAYLLALGRQIESTQLTMDEQVAVVDQLRRALGEETDESVRRDILSMLENLNGKPWTTKWTEREVAALLYAHAPRPRSQGDRVDGTRRTDHAEEKPKAATEPDPREWFAERLDRVLQQRSAEESATGADPAYWRPPADAATHWSRTFGNDGQADSAPGMQSSAGPQASSGAQSSMGAPFPTGTASSPGAPFPAGTGFYPGSSGRHASGGPSQPGMASAAGRPGPTTTSPPPFFSPAPPHFSAAAPPQGPAAADTGPQPAQPGPQPGPQASAQQTAPRGVPQNQWAPPAGAPMPPSPPNYWGMSIVSFLLSLLFGGIAMYFSYQVGQRYRAADLDGARRASRNAKVWGIVGIVVGGLALVFAMSYQG